MQEKSLMIGNINKQDRICLKGECIWMREENSAIYFGDWLLY